jgi:hypothetical protein
VYQSLAPAGQLVVVDRAPAPAEFGNRQMDGHEISAERVESELHQANYEILSRQDRFIERDPDNEAWWLIVARRP